jgi:hypothetical protein
VIVIAGVAIVRAAETSVEKGAGVETRRAAGVAEAIFPHEISFRALRATAFRKALDAVAWALDASLFTASEKEPSRQSRRRIFTLLHLRKDSRSDRNLIVPS